MKILLSYIRRNVFQIFTVFVCLGFMTVFLILNQTGLSDIVYGAALFLFVAAVLFCIGFLQYRGRYLRLQESRRQICTSLEGMEKAEDLLEEEWQDIIRELFYDRAFCINRMEKKNRDRKEYDTMWAHQIKTPMAALKLLFQEKEGSTDLTEEKAELFLIEQYVEMILSYSRLESDTTDFVFQKTPLDGIIRNAVRKYAVLFVKKKLTLSYEGTDKEIVTDEKWLGFVMEQVLSNAVKYTKNGTVSIKVLPEQEGGAVIVIEDTGIGIRTEDLPRIFEQGYTGYNGREDRSSTGIGLFLCRQVMDKLGQGIEVESEEGKGTKVSLKLNNHVEI